MATLGRPSPSTTPDRNPATWLAGLISALLWISGLSVYLTSDDQLLSASLLATGNALGGLTLALSLAGSQNVLLMSLSIGVAYSVVAWVIAPTALMLAGPLVPHGLPGGIGSEIRPEVEISFLAFLIGISLGAIPFMRRRSPPQSPTKDAAAIERGVVAVALASLYARVALEYAGATGWPLFLAQGANNYLTGMFLLVGMRWHFLRRSDRLLLVWLLVPPFLGYTLANSRGLALAPAVLVFAGWLLAPTSTIRTKSFLATVGLAVLPVYLLVANQSRLALGTLGFSDLSARQEALVNATRNTMDTETGGAMTDALARVQHLAGQSIIIAEWHNQDFRGPPLADFVDEVATAITPKWAGDEAGIRGMDNSASQIFGSVALYRYGFDVTENTGVEPSMIGSFYLLGGLAAVLIGAAAFAALVGMLSTSRVLSAPGIGMAISSCLAFQTILGVSFDPGRVLKSFIMTTAYAGAVALLVHHTLSLLKGRRPRAPRRYSTHP